MPNTCHGAEAAVFDWFTNVHFMYCIAGSQQVGHESREVGRIDGEGIAPHEVCNQVIQSAG